jgi:histidine triad (HIT) family protein
MDDCIFCKIVRGDFGTTFIAENEHAVAFADIAPIAPVHTLVVPRRHIGSIADAAHDDLEMLASCMLLANEVARVKGVAESGYRVGWNVGDDSGQTVFHLHFHVFGGKRLGAMA